MKVEIKVKGENFKLVSIDKLVPHPRNNNRHSVEQIERLCELIIVRGFRNPLTVSNQSGFIVCGEGRYLAAKKLGMKKLPVIYQDFESEAEEFQHLTADNEIARWAELDHAKMINDAKELQIPQEETIYLGLEKEVPLFSDIEGVNLDELPLDQEKKDSSKVCPSCGYTF